MDVLCSIEDGIQLDLDLARLQLAEARRGQRDDDTPAARRRVDEARTLADGLLDMWNEASPAPTLRDDGRQTPAG
jgi:hypothetical protein